MPGIAPSGCKCWRGLACRDRTEGCRRWREWPGRFGRLEQLRQNSEDEKMRRWEGENAIKKTYATFLIALLWALCINLCDLCGKKYYRIVTSSNCHISQSYHQITGNPFFEKIYVVNLHFNQVGPGGSAFDRLTFHQRSRVRASARSLLLDFIAR